MNQTGQIVFIIFIIVLQQLEGNLIYPRVVGSSIGLPGIWVLAAIMVGSGLGGVVGMLVGVPISAAAYKLLKDATAKKEAEKGIVVEPKETITKEKVQTKQQDDEENKKNPISTIRSVDKIKRKYSKKKNAG